MEEKKDKLFREKSLQKISSPEDLDKYIKTASPTVIILFVAVIIFLVGFIVWGIVGQIEVKSTIGIKVETGGEVTAVITSKDYESYIEKKGKDYVTSKMYVSFGNNSKLKITSYTGQPLTFAMTKVEPEERAVFTYSNISDGQLYFELKCENVTTDKGIYKGKIVYSYSNPIGYIF